MAAPLQLLTGNEKDIGGFTVRRILPQAQRRMIGPFIFWDEMGPATFDPGHGIDVRPHPHIGLATVTYLFAGEILHRDTLGVVQSIAPGDVNLMTAGRGIVHSERTHPDLRASGQVLHGIQSWIALPADQEETAPAFHHFGRDALPLIEEPGMRLRLIMGSGFGAASPVPAPSPIVYADAHLSAGARLPLPGEHEEVGLYVVTGAVTVDGQEVTPHRLAALPAGTIPAVEALSDARVMVMGGQTLGERHMHWNFVASDRTRITKARADWQASIDAGFKGTVFSLPDGEDGYIPLPAGQTADTPPDRTEECPTS